MRIGLIRHGETEWNVRGLYQGTSDIPLNGRGEEQARDAGRLLRGQGWRCVLASPLSRARRTAEIIAGQMQLAAPGVLAGMAERSFGKLEGTSFRSRDGSRVPLEKNAEVEPEERVLERVRAELDGLVRDGVEGPALIVTHGTVIRLLLDCLLDVPAPRMSNLGLSVLEWEPHGTHRVLLANGYPPAPLA